jgi:hypothetical protein
MICGISVEPLCPPLCPGTVETLFAVFRNCGTSVSYPRVLPCVRELWNLCAIPFVQELWNLYVLIGVQELWKACPTL